MKRIGISNCATGVKVRGINHFSECIVAQFPTQTKDEECTCWDTSPDWTDD
jgi:hypothetical protein